MNKRGILGIVVAAALLFGAGIGYSKSDKAGKKPAKTEKTCSQKCTEQYDKDMTACKLKKGKDADRCKKDAQTKQEICKMGCKKQK